MARADRWVRGEITRAVQHGYLAAAERDDLAVTPRRTTRPKPENSTRVRRRVLRRFAAALGVTVHLPPPPPERVHLPVTRSQLPRLLPRPAPPSPQQGEHRFLQEHVLAHVTAWAEAAPERGGLRDMYARLACVVALVVETAARTSELLALTVDDFAPDLSTVSLIRQPQGGWPSDVETLPLSPVGRRAVRVWLHRRVLLVRQLDGAPPRQLLVSVRPGSSLRRAGMPISHPDVLQRQYAAAVRQLNADMHARRAIGWRPLPRTLERLRHASDKPTRAVQDADAPPENTAATAA